METRDKSCCFIGHREIRQNDKLTESLRDSILNLINIGVYRFLFGSNSEFNALCHRIVCNLKKDYPHLVRVYVRAEYPVINEKYRKYLLTLYEDTYFPDCLLRAGKAVYIERNFEMINQCSYCIAYYDGRNTAKSKEKRSGTELAYKYAEKRGLSIQNIYKTD